MWLLDTATAVLHEFVSPEKVPGGYAILSHVWRNNEQSFQDVKAIIKRCKRWGINPRTKVSEKIRRCCEIAEGEGYKWVWIDTCCIDKTSSAELSEAINSMFRYYTLSTVCFVYLHDVEDNHTSEAKPELSGTRWMKRGWTLQELIAPNVVIMLSSSWTPIGSKHDLAPTLEKITGIPTSLLRHKTNLSNYSVAQRMSWAARRETKRIEDEAYCLLGIFDINMPTVYGEGRRAFQRLQEEIMKSTLDPSLFAWGHYTANLRDHSTNTYPLLAQAPSDFRGCSKVRYIPNSNGPRPHMSFTVTPHGILARVPLVFETFIDLSCTLDGKAAILLRVEQLTKGAVHFVIGDREFRRRFWIVDAPHRQNRKWTKIYVANDTYGPVSHTAPGPSGFPCNGSPSAPFHFSITLNAPMYHTDSRVHAEQGVEASWTPESPPAVINIVSSRGKILFPIICGICTAPVGNPPQPPSSHIHWARVPWVHFQPKYRHSFDPYAHNCTRDHILDWTDGKMVFQVRDGEWKAKVWEVELSFVKSKMYPNTRILRSVTWDEPGVPRNVSPRGKSEVTKDFDAVKSRSARLLYQRGRYPLQEALSRAICR